MPADNGFDLVREYQNFHGAIKSEWRVGKLASASRAQW